MYVARKRRAKEEDYAGADSIDVGQAAGCMNRPKVLYVIDDLNGVYPTLLKRWDLFNLSIRNSKRNNKQHAASILRWDRGLSLDQH